MPSGREEFWILNYEFWIASGTWRIMNFELWILNCLRNVENSELWFMISELPPDENFFYPTKDTNNHEWFFSRESQTTDYSDYSDYFVNWFHGLHRFCKSLCSCWPPGVENSEFWNLNSELPPDEYLFDPTKDTDNHEYFCLTQRAQRAQRMRCFARMAHSLRLHCAISSFFCF